MAMEDGERNVIHRPKPGYANGVVPELRMEVMNPSPSYEGAPYELPKGASKHLAPNPLLQPTYVRALEEKFFSVKRQHDALLHQIRLTEGQLTLLKEDEQIIWKVLQESIAGQNREIESHRAAAKRYETQRAVDAIASDILKQRQATKTKGNATKDSAPSSKRRRR